MKKQLVFMVICLFMIVMLSGCWDGIAIERHGFVIGSALDIEDMDQEERAEETSGNDPPLSLTNQIVIPSEISSPGGEGGGNKEPHTNIKVTGDTVMEMSRDMANILGRTPFYEHLQIIVISEEIAEKEQMIGSIMDVFIRDHEMRRENKVIISEGRAEEILNIEPDTEELPIMYIKETMESTRKTIEAVEPLVVGKLQSFLLEEGSYAVPRVTPLKDNKGVNYGGVAVFQGHNNTMVGTLDIEETKGLNLIKEDLDGGMLKIKVNGEFMVFEIEQTKSDTTVEVHDRDNIEINVQIEAKGRIGEMFGSRSLLDENYLKEIEKSINEKIERLANLALEKGQKELGTDVFDFGDKIRQRHYSTWKEIKDDWETGENIFANSDVNVSANAKVRATGASDKVKLHGEDEGSE